MQDHVSEATLMSLENRAYALLSDRSVAMATPIVTKKFATNDNRLIYVTQCTVAESAVPNLRIQTFERVTGGVMERSYALYADRRFERTDNPMIFTERNVKSELAPPVAITENEAVQLLALVEHLATLEG